MLRKDSQSYVCLKDRPPGLWSQVEKSKNFCMEFLSDNDKIVIENGYCFNPETTIGIIFGEPCAPYDSERVQAIEALLQIPDCIIALQNISGKKCGANSG